ncbi:unnamed protein product [Psylliodes chrysocephalus]|uniref:Uncharacterized protein n=1 Tax=Psylliodes chrysocephalus TaxID=3402493 RepID=A0A9P0G8N0_9CUCU|nr:unnamed protein product [Psylliodes chrysocephala]
MHREYVKCCLERQIEPASITVLKNVMKDENIAIHKPEKDQCDICCSHKLGYIPDEEYQLNIQRKNDARDDKNATKARAIANNDYLAITMDLRSVLFPEGIIWYKMHFKEDWEEPTQRRQSATDRERLTQLYDKPLSISESKFKDLQNLKSAIEKEYHALYGNLSFKLFSENAAENHNKKPEEKTENERGVLRKQSGNKRPTEKLQKDKKLSSENAAEN